MKLLGYTIHTRLPDFSLNKQLIINTINPHSYCVSKLDKGFEKALKSSDVLLPDGVGIVWAAKLICGKKIKKIAGYDVFEYLLEKLNKNGGSCFFMGGSESTLKLIETRLRREYPNVRVSSYSPPYKAVFSEEDNVIMREKINASEPDILFVGMTAPKQEKWVFDNKKHIKASVICSIGAVFDFYAGTVERPSRFWIDLGLEWFPRFLKEPKRLAERNLISTPKFIAEVLSFKLRNKGFL